MPAPELLDDEIGRKLAEAQANGELKSAAGYGQPLPEDEEGWLQTPEELRMGFKILKNSGFVPPEIELFHTRARLRAELETATTEAQRQALRLALSELEQKLSLRLESLRMSASR